MNEQTLKLLEKALNATPEDWETRAHLIDQYLAIGSPERAAQLLKSAPVIPDTEPDALRKARVELETAPSDAIITLQNVLARNKACAEAYLLMAKVYQKNGLRDKARKKYGAATIIDENLRDPQLEQWLGISGASEHPDPPASVPVDPANDQGESSAVGVPAQSNPDEFVVDEPQQTRVTFDDIGGMEDVIERIRMNIIYPFKNPAVFQKFNKKPGGGILMYGPPGCGKTHIARATAGECGAVFISIAITDILSRWLGESEQRLHRYFETARRRSPAVIFIDEIDAIGVSRSDAGASMAPIVNVLLTEMDGLDARNDNVMILAATNSPWRVDSALRRPGRFDRVLFVPPPDEAAREAILKIRLRDMPVESLDLKKLAKLADRFSGADLRAVVERASEKAIYEEMTTGHAGKLTQRLLTDAIKDTRPSTSEWLETARSYATYANRTGLYDDLISYFEKH
ncbi:MAG TPA: AAA family ATPase [Candidatus Sulfotelmatobacter sp.]|nr:AAA family ATPase [Candidatus Sulfotelmatobacter sp.]